MEEGLLVKEEEGWRWGVYVEEVKKVGYIAAPMVVVTLSQYLLQVVSLMMVGHLGELSLSSAAIATSLTTVTGFSLLLGMASALETLCGQAYGAKQYRHLGLQMHRAIVSLVLVCLPLSCIWFSMGRLLIFIGQDPDISLEAGKYARWLIPGLFAYAVAQPLMKFLQAQSLVLPMFLTTFTTLCIHIPLCWVLVFKSCLGNVGAALATSISFWLNVLILGVYVFCAQSCEKTRVRFSREVFHGMGGFFRLAFASALMICLQWWSFELLILLSGLLPNPKLEASVLSICLTTISSLYSIPYGLGAAARTSITNSSATQAAITDIMPIRFGNSTRVANELGAGKPRAARIAVFVVMSLAVANGLIVSTALFSLRHILGYAFSNEDEVVDYVVIMAPLISLSVIMDSLQGGLSGIARGCGWQHIGALVNLGAFYLVGLPVAIVLAFVIHMSGKGLWIGVLSGSTVQSTLLSLITALTNWQLQANKARERILEERLRSDIEILE